MDDLIRTIAEKHSCDDDLIRRMIDYEQSKVHLERRRGAKDELRRLLEKHTEESEQ